MMNKCKSQKKVALSVLLFYCFITSIQTYSQEGLLPIRFNPMLMGMNKMHHPKSNAQVIKPDTLALPFLDDFSKPGVFPDSTKWIDRNVFINRTFAISPPSLGVATFDGLDSTGFPFNFSPGANPAGDADHLTSFPINLYNYQYGNSYATYAALDSIYLSFYYQSGGHGTYPGPNDSLVLDFKHCFKDTIYLSDSVKVVRDTCIWDWQWSKPGYAPNFLDTGFHQVLIRVQDQYLFKGFQFRFRNYAHLNGNMDQWHVDYVYLNKRKNGLKDSIYSDVSFVYNPSSLLKNYQAMPWEQYMPSELRDSLLKDSIGTLRTCIRNSDTTQKNTFYSYSISNQNGQQLANYPKISINIQPFNKNGYCNYAPFVKPPMVYTIPMLNESSTFTWTNIIRSIPDIESQNDTVSLDQHFANYYAYDDGTAERGYFLTGTLPSLAMRFKLNVADTLRAVQLYFNPITTDASKFFFRPAIWTDDQGIPGRLLYKDSVVNPVYGDTIIGGFNQFTTYPIANPNLVLPAGEYYMGWIQSSSDILNVGFDRNTDASSQTFINVSGYWQPSIIHGSVMFRPLFRGHYTAPAGVAEVNNRPSIEIFPNPCHENLNIIYTRGEFAITNLAIYSILGVLQWEQSFNQFTPINLSGLSPGIYMLKATTANHQEMIKQIVKY